MNAVFPLLGFVAERHRLAAVFRQRESLLLTGPAGAGKTTLIEATIADMEDSKNVVRVRYSSNLHHLLVALTRTLLAGEHKSLKDRARPGRDIDKWLCGQTSLHLKGLLWTSLEVQPLTIVLDGIDGGSFPMYRFLQRLYFVPGMAIIGASRDTASLGTLSRLFWDPRRILHLRPLNETDSEQLFQLAARRFAIEDLALDDFREKVLEAARGNPGEIVEMCRLAANPLYISGKHIKFAPLRIDVMMRFLSTVVGQRSR